RAAAIAAGSASGNLLADVRCARCARGVLSARCAERRVMRVELARYFMFSRLRFEHRCFRRGLLFLREDDAAFVEPAFRRRELLAQLLVSARFAGLALERIQIARDLAQRVVDAEEVLL